MFLDNGRTLYERVEAGTVECPVLTESDVNHSHGPIVWKAASFIGNPHFYPLYAYNDYYSYSLLALIIKKGSLVIDQSVLDLVRKPGFTCVMSDQVLDKEIVRIGSAHATNGSITDVDDFAEQIVHALRKDTADIEKANSGYTNVILCGGKDSMNLLLLPWKNPTIAVSAEPNFSNTCKFVEQNDLDIHVLKLDDEMNTDELQDEILECCCRVELSHWRWGASLRRIALDLDKKVVFWKGQAGDLYMSTTWKTYMHPIRPSRLFFRRAYKRLSPHMPFFAARAIGRCIQPAVIGATWNRTASLQGSHMGFLRAITDCLTVSAYHGPEMIKVWEKADLASVSQHDMRHLVGRLLLGRQVLYPESNPGPLPSSFRQGLSNPDRFLSLIKETGVKIM